MSPSDVQTGALKISDRIQNGIMARLEEFEKSPSSQIWCFVKVRHCIKLDYTADGQEEVQMNKSLHAIVIWQGKELQLTQHRLRRVRISQTWCIQILMRQTTTPGKKQFKIEDYDDPEDSYNKQSKEIQLSKTWFSYNHPTESKTASHST